MHDRIVKIKSKPTEINQNPPEHQPTKIKKNTPGTNQNTLKPTKTNQTQPKATQTNRYEAKPTKTKQPIKRGGEITPIDRATLDLKISRDKLSKYRKKLALDSDKLATRAKALHAEGKTKNALQLMRLRKYKLAEADRVEEQLLTVLQMAFWQ